MQMFEIAWTSWTFAGVGFLFGVLPSILAVYYVHRVECENRELKSLLKLAGDKIQRFLDARRKGAHVTNSRRKK